MMAAGEFANRVALVTGASRGIGRGCAERLARGGAVIALVARNEDDLRACATAIDAAGGDAHLHAADVTVEEAVADAVAFAESLGDLRICVNAAGTNLPGPARDYPLAQWDALFAVNVRATFIVCRAVGDSLLRRGKPGAIVNVSSQMGQVGYPGRAAYCATKHAVEGLSKARRRMGSKRHPRQHRSADFCRHRPHAINADRRGVSRRCDRAPADTASGHRRGGRGRRALPGE
jgi:NAD(P)-dependent dehydrogenase (short-subunit alcohol dehydrogenase family)